MVALPSQGQDCLKGGIVFAVFLILSLSSCQIAAPLTPIPTSEQHLFSPTLQATPAQSLSGTTTPLPLSTPEAVNDPVLPSLSVNSTLPREFYEPAGCWQPPDDYSIVKINGQSINARTYAMLRQAAVLYDGEIDVAGSAIIQGGYNNSQDNLGTHHSGGAVDISVMRNNSQYILYHDIEPLIRALRTAGFAAWLREDNDEEPGSKIHIHAVPIGDIDLSTAAQEQITGRAGYLRGYNGLSTTKEDDPEPDHHGEPLICHWMLELGYKDMRPPTPVRANDLPWQERLLKAALAYQAFYPEDAKEIAHNLNFLDGKSESAENICGPLSAAILRDAGLLPAEAGPVQNLKSYWQASPIQNGRPWSLFSDRDYEVYRFTTPFAEFDFTAWPLQPADFVYLYAKDHGFDHMFVVTEVDAEGRAYTVTNQVQSWGNEIWGSFLILRYLLYDPQAPGDGIIYNEWSNSRLGMSGQNGFEVLRKRGLKAGSQFRYTIRPGDTLLDLSIRYGAKMESITQANPGINLANLHVNEVITIPIPIYSISPED